MTTLTLSHHNGHKVYSLTGTAVPDWLAWKRKKELKKVGDWGKRVSLIQEFGFPDAGMLWCKGVRGCVTGAENFWSNEPYLYELAPSLQFLFWIYIHLCIPRSYLLYFPPRISTPHHL